MIRCTTSHWLAMLATLSILCLAPGARSAFADTPGLRVGVVVVTAIGMDLDDAEMVGTRMARALGERLFVDVEVGTRERLGQRPSETCVAEIPCIHEVGAKLNVHELLFLAIVRIGDRLQINITWADAASGASEARDPIRLEGATQDLDAFTEAATRLLPNARSRPAAPLPETVPPAGPLAPVTGEPGPIDGRRLTRGVWIAGGISALALAGGTTLGIMALRTQSRLEDAGCDPGPCEQPAPKVSTLRQQAAISDALFAGALISGVVAGVLYWRSGRADARTVTVGATPTGVQLSVSGSF